MASGDIRLGDTIDIKFTTSVNGVPTQLAGTPAVSAYPANSVTQLTAGITLTADFDSLTGLNNVNVVASSGNGYATATNYCIVITTGTVGGSSVVGTVVGEFSIENRSALIPTTAARTLDVSAGGEAGIDWANIGSPTTAQNLSATNIDVDQVVASVSGAVGSVTGAVGSIAAGGVTATSIATGAIDADALAADAVAEIADGVWDEDATGHQTGGTFGQAIGDPAADTNTIYGATVTGAAGATVAADIIAVKADTAAILIDTAEIGAAGAGLTAINLPDQTMNITGDITGNLSGSVGSVAGAVGSVGVGGIATTSFAAGAIDAAAIAANAIGAAELATDAVNEIRDAIRDLAMVEPSAVPAVTGTLRDVLSWLLVLSRNKITQTATTQLVRNDADAATIATSTHSDDGTTHTRGEFV